MKSYFLYFLFALAVSVMTYPHFASAEDEKDAASSKKVSAQQVGGLLFDMDEGVEIEQGPGGSVYMKSNREFMKNKFEAIESRLTDLEERMQKIEAQMPKAAAADEKETEEAAAPTGVLVS